MTQTTYCTIATAAELPRALVLRDSLARAGGLADAPRFRVLVAEHPAEVARLRTRLAGIDLLAPDEIGLPGWAHLAFCFTAEEYQAVLLPALLRTLARRGRVVYLAPETQVFAPVVEIERALDEADLVVAPRHAAPLRDDAPMKYDARALADALRQGPFGLGFVAAQGPGSEAALAAWQALAEEHAASASILALTTDHSEAPLPALVAAALVSFAPRLRVLREAHVHTGPWNAAQHGLALGPDGAPRTADGPLVLLQFAGSAPAGKDADTGPDGALRRLFAGYAAALAAAPHRELASTPWSFAAYHDGQPIPLSHRRLFLRLPRANRRLIVNPFIERAYFERVAQQSLASRAPDYHSAIERCAELERRMNVLPYSLVGHVGNALNRLAPGSKDAVYNVLQNVSRSLSSGDLGRSLGQARALLRRS